MNLLDIFSEDNKLKFGREAKSAELLPVNKSIKNNQNEVTKKVDIQVSSSDDERLEESVDDVNTNNEIENIKRQDDEDKSNRTIFIGNISIKCTQKELKKIFETYGEIESIRLRSVPYAGTAVDQNGNQSMVRKVCSIQGKFGEQKGSMNAYIVYKDVTSITQALSANNTIIHERHIRVDLSKPSILEPRRTVFIGSLPLYTDEEELRNHFAEVLPNGHDDIECVRIIRDSDSLIGKGIAYISFTNSECVVSALSLHQKKFKKRELRVTMCHKNNKKSKNSDITTDKSKITKRKFISNNNSNTTTTTTTTTTNNNNNSNNNDQPRIKKPRHNRPSNSESNTNNTTIASTTPTNISTSTNTNKMSVTKQAKLNAMRRINLKSVNTRNKVLVERGQKSNKKKSKPVSGSVKRAIKAMHNAVRKKK